MPGRPARRKLDRSRRPGQGGGDERPTQTFQLSVEAAEAYEARFVPAIFADWAPHLVEAAGVAPGQAVLDVACGTGVVARTAADRMGGRGRVAGADRNEGMLAVARRLRPDPEWHRADAADLPFEDGSFEAVLCQSALMFFPDRVGAFARHLGPEAAEVGGAYWALGDLELLGSLFEAAGLEVTGTRTRVGTVRFGSAAEAVATEIEATPLAARVDPGTHRRLVDAGVQALARFVVDGGRVELPIGGHLVTAFAPG